MSSCDDCDRPRSPLRDAAADELSDPKRQAARERPRAPPFPQIRTPGACGRSHLSTHAADSRHICGTSSRGRQRRSRDRDRPSAAPRTIANREGAARSRALTASPADCEERANTPSGRWPRPCRRQRNHCGTRDRSHREGSPPPERARASPPDQTAAAKRSSWPPSRNGEHRRLPICGKLPSCVPVRPECYAIIAKPFAQ